jgi:hypothetical protein
LQIQFKGVLASRTTKGGSSAREKFVGHLESGRAARTFDQHR